MGVGPRKLGYKLQKFVKRREKKKKKFPSTLSTSMGVVSVPKVLTLTRQIVVLPQILLKTVERNKVLIPSSWKEI